MQTLFADADHKNKNNDFGIMDTIIKICLFFIFAGAPLIINPFAFDYWYKPKIDSIYCLIIILAIAAGIKYISLKKNLPVKGNPLIIPLIIYGIASVVSTIFSIDTTLSIYGDLFREEGIFTIISYLIITVIFSTVIASEDQLHALLRGLLISAALVSLYALIQYAGYNPTEYFIPQFRGVENRPGSTIGNPNFLGKFLVLIVPLFMVKYIVSEKRTEKLLLLTGCSISLGALIVTFTRASWVSLFISFAMLAILLRRTVSWRNQKGLLALSVFILCFIAFVELRSPAQKTTPDRKVMPTISKKIETTFDVKLGGIGGRLYLWEKALVVIKERPLTGYGLDTQGIAMQRFNLEYARKFKYSGVIDRAHNNYLDTAIAQGLLGLAAYLSIIITFLAWLVRTLKAEADASRRLLYCGILAAVCGYLLNDFFIFSVVSVSPTFWSLLGLTISIKRLNGLAPCYKA